MTRLNRNLNNPYGIKIDMFYVNLVITEKPDKLDESYVTRAPILQDCGRRVDLKDIFDRPVHDADSPKILMVTGPPGIGKSTLTQRLVYSWADAQLWNEKYDIVVHLRCRELAEQSRRVHGKKTISMCELLFNHDVCRKTEDKDIVLKYISENKQRLLIVIDGLDELTTWSEAAKESTFETIGNLETESGVHNIIHNVITGNILVGADIIVTTRPMEHLDKVPADSFISILGFDEKSVQKCLGFTCNNDEHIQLQMIKVLEESQALYNMCVVPLFCVLFGVIVKEVISGKHSIEITNTTQMMIRAVHHILTRRQTQETKLYVDSISKPVVTHIVRLSKLAATGTLQGPLKLIFTSEDIKDCDIDLDSSNGFLESFTEDMLTTLRPETSFSFLHFLFQEFFTAVHVCLTWSDEDLALLSRFHSRRLDNVQLFVAGLLGDKKMGHDFLKTLGLDASSMDSWFDTLK